MIFKTFNSDIDKISSKWGIFGRSFNDIGTAIVGRITDINKAFQATGDLVGSIKDSESIWKRLYPSKESIKEQLIDVDNLIPKIDKENFDFDFDHWINELNNVDKQVKAGTKSWQDYSNGLNDNQKWIAKWGQETEGQIRTQSDLVKANQQARASALAHNEAIKAQTFSAKVGKVALQALAMAGNMLAMWAIGKVITAFDNWIHSMDNAKEELEEANSKLKKVNSELEATASRINELNAKENLSLVETEELEKLKTTNAELERELRIREELAKVKGAKANKEALLYFNSTSGSFWESFFANLKDSITNFDFFGGENLSFDTSPVFVDKVSEAEYYIEQAEKLKQKLAKITDKDSKDYKSTSAAIKKIEENLSKTIVDFMEKDDLLIEGEDHGLLERLDALYEKYDVYTNGNAYVIENKLSSILAKIDFADNAKELEELGKSGELSLDKITSKFPNLIAYLDEAGISAQELYQYIMALTNPDAINYSNVKKQLLYSIGGRQDEAQESLREILSLDKEEFVLDAYLKVRAQYGDHPEGWTAKDWIYNIQQELNDNPVEFKTSISTFEDAWADSLTSENEAVNELGNNLLKLAAQGRLTKEAFNEADSTAGDHFKNLDISAEEAVSKINQLVDESSQLSSMSSQISKISEVLGTKRDNGFVNADTLSGFDAEIRGLDSWDRFQEVLGSTTSSYDECQEAANALATEWVNSSDFLAQLTEQNEEYYAAQLKAMGIENYEEIIAYAHLAQQQMWSLALAKQAASDDSLNTADDCQRLLNLAQNAGVTGKAISLLTELMGIYNNLSHGIYGTDTDTLNEITTRAESIKQNVLNLLSNYSSNTVEPKPRIKLSPRAKETAGSAGRSAAEAFTEALDKGLAALDKNLDAGYIVFKDYIQARLALIEDYYAQGKLSADEYYSYLEKHYDTQLSYMDKVVNAVTRRINTELDALKQQKEDLENFYKTQIDSLEKQKTLLEEANQERQRQKDLQKSLYDMERARNQRTQMVYTEGRGMHYAADDQAIRDAQENVDNARYDMQLAEIEKAVSKLEAARDRETGVIDGKISDLETYRDAWSDITSAYAEEQENLIAAQILGADWETDILNGRLGILDAFKDQYISIQQAMADAAWQSANEQMKAAKEAEKGASGSKSDAPKIGGDEKTPPADNDLQTSGASNGSSANLHHLAKNKVTFLRSSERYTSGTQHAKKGLNLVGEDGAEAYFDNHGHAAIVTGPTLIPMEGGEVVKNERDTKKLLDPDNLVPVNAVGFDNTDGKDVEYPRKLNAETITLSDGTVLTPVQPGGKMYDIVRRFNAYWGNKNADRFTPDLMFEHNKQMLETSNQITGNNSMVNHNRNMQPVITQNITLTCPNVTNNSGVEYIQRELGHLSQMALQESMKR